jgi:farnesyl-diphosphate farnesyltransferase
MFLHESRLVKAFPAPSSPRQPPPTAADESFQEASLQQVSRTFALTIPVLPSAVRRAVANGYLLCRIADTIEDDAAMGPDLKAHYAEWFIAAVEGSACGDALGAELAPLLASQTPPPERELVAQTAGVLRITHSLPPRQQAALARCVAIMSRGMADFQAQETRAGLATRKDMDNYCYFVAGVVGEMLTEVFCDSAEDINAHRDALMPLSVSFGQALQMTNIIKDVWEDRARGACWMPRDVFARHGCDLGREDLDPDTPGFSAALDELIGVARGHLRNALHYVELIPTRHSGIRRFCLWALAMAVMTLRKVHATPGFSTGSEVKIRRSTVRRVVALMNLSTGSNTLLRMLLAIGMYRLPCSGERDTISSTKNL